MINDAVLRSEGRLSAAVGAAVVRASSRGTVDPSWTAVGRLNAELKRPLQKPDRVSGSVAHSLPRMLFTLSMVSIVPVVSFATNVSRVPFSSVLDNTKNVAVEATLVKKRSKSALLESHAPVQG